MKKVLRLLNKKQKLNFLLIISFALLLSLIEVIIFTFIQPVINFFSGSARGIENYFLKNFFSNTNNIQLILIILFCTFILRTVTSIILTYLRQNLNRSVDYHLSNRLYSKYIHKDYSFFLNSNSSNFFSSIIIEIDRFASNLLNSVTLLIVDVILIFFISIYLLINHFTASVILIFVILLLFLFFYFFYTSKFKDLGQKKTMADRKKISWLQKSFDSIQAIKLENLEFFFKEKYKIEVARSSRSTFIMNFISELPRNSAEMIIIIVGSALLYVLYYHFNLSEGTVLSILGLFIIAMFRILPSSNRILYAFNNIKYNYSTLNNLNQLIEDNIEGETKTQTSVTNNIPTLDTITLNNVSYIYENVEKNKKVLDNINLILKKNTVIGICGENGSGKSTLLNIITGLLNPTSGSVELNQKNIIDFKKLYQSTIGYVTQKIYLTDDSIIDNVIFGVDKNFYDYDKFKNAIELSRLKEVVNNLPYKENTTIGERGLKLSGGQQQRIAIARALYKDPQLLIFDEATAALDMETVTEFLNLVVSKKKLSKTIIIVSHSKKILGLCDDVYLLKNGSLNKLKL
jgi:ABC-type bacteriocin/lantibiotic exporter with double-glycine peptidase domain